MKLVVDVLGIFRFVSIVTDPQVTIKNYICQIEREFQQMYTLAISPQFSMLSRFSSAKDLLLPSDVVGVVLTEGEKLLATPDEKWAETLRQSPWAVLGIDETEFEVRIELLRKIYGEQCNFAVLGSCLLRASGNLSKATAICSFIRPDILNSTRRIIFVRPRESTVRRVDLGIGSEGETRKVKL
ncbi:hypothetical protein GL50803_0015110 [Giardia duodenalis]|uniref:Uncharacterized protein n=1 Tax=Giardia intestinalis (strain ATCC 50803 / WB clone C6) TaxID=184922 RepID=A8BS26_GIAIC|nr:hypothetical protein GL50803_0015110 [Giardia intestinalis]KAE8304734.1 hypothetical protein GL50803_0015110 [Giardia intestinalis]|eukprot:XP_001705134.1 Hypothetical protein GL50803_15110 [Giardia lamblia ATCC 50803]